MIPQETIEQIRQATDIVQIIGEYLRLKKRGKNHLALCPFHSEKTPSFNVSSDKQIYHCFGCGKGGNAITFLMEHEKMSFVEAVKHLARKANIAIVEEKQSEYKREIVERLNYANYTAMEYFQKTLHHNKYADVLIKYLKGKRSISNEAIEYFNIGLAGEEWDSFIKYASKKDLSPEELEQAGLVLYSEKTKKHFDRFRHRLMFPIMNLSGKPIAFGGRTLKKGEPAKYMNSPETKLYSKGNVLYGLNLAKDAIRKSKFVYIVEGYFDVISLWQVGIKNVVASSGTAFTAQQARLLARFAEEVFLFFDADSAGRNAALKSVDVLYDSSLEVKIIVPPDGEDPDSLTHKYGRDKIDILKEDSIGFIPFRIKDFDKESAGIISKEKLIKEFSIIGSKIKDQTRRSLFFQEAAEQMGVDTNLFTQQSKPVIDEGTEITSSRRKKHNAIEVSFLSLLFNNPGIIDSIFEQVSPEDFDSKELSRLYSAIIAQYKLLGIVDAKALIDNLTDLEFISTVTEVASIEWDNDQIESETMHYLKMIIEEKLKRIRNKLLKELAEAEKAGDQQRATQIIEQMKSYGLNA